MEKLALPIGLAIVAVGLAVYGVHDMKSMLMPAKTKETCDALLVQEVQNGLKTGDECALWFGNECRKGTFDQASGMCYSKGSVVPLLSLGLAVILFIVAVVMTVMRLRKH